MRFHFGKKCCIFAVPIIPEVEDIPFAMELVIVIAFFVVLPLVSIVCIVMNGIRSGHSRWKIIINGVLSLLFFLAFYFFVGRAFLNR